MNYSVKQFKDLLKKIPRELEIIKGKSLFIEITMVDIPSTSIIRISNDKKGGRNSKSPVEKKVMKVSEVKDEIAASWDILDLMYDCINKTDPYYHLMIRKIYCIPDEFGNTNSANKIAKRYNEDRRTLPTRIDHAMEEALKDSRVINNIDKIRKIAEKNGRYDYLDIFNSKGNRS